MGLVVGVGQWQRSMEWIEVWLRAISLAVVVGG